MAKTQEQLKKELDDAENEYAKKFSAFMKKAKKNAAAAQKRALKSRYSK